MGVVCFCWVVFVIKRLKLLFVLIVIFFGIVSMVCWLGWVLWRFLVIFVRVISILVFFLFIFLNIIYCFVLMVFVKVFFIYLNVFGLLGEEIYVLMRFLILMEVLVRGMVNIWLEGCWDGKSIDERYWRMCVFFEEGGEVSSIGDECWIRGYKVWSVLLVGVVCMCMVVKRGLRVEDWSINWFVIRIIWEYRFDWLMIGICR